MITEEEIIDKAISLVTLITTNEAEETSEGDVVVEILEAIEKVDTIEKIKEIGPKGEISVETVEDAVGEVIIIVVTTTTIDNKVKDPKGIGRTRISHKLIFVIFLRSKSLLEEALVTRVLTISGISKDCEK